MISYCPSWYKIGSSKLLVKAVAQMIFSSRLSFIHLTQTFRLSLPSTSVVTAPRHNWQILAQCMFWFLQWVDENHNAKPSDQWHKLIHSAEQVRLGGATCWGSAERGRQAELAAGYCWCFCWRSVKGKVWKNAVEHNQRSKWALSHGALTGVQWTNWFFIHQTTVLLGNVCDSSPLYAK